MIFSEAAADRLLRACDHWGWNWYAQELDGRAVRVSARVARDGNPGNRLSHQDSAWCFWHSPPRLFSVTGIHVSQHFKLAWLQFWAMEGSGCVLLALGIVAIMSVDRVPHEESRMILAGYLIPLSSPHAPRGPGIPRQPRASGRAWSILKEIMPPSLRGA